MPSLPACACSSANGMQQKLYNLNTLNARVLKRLGFQLPRPDIEAIASAQPGAKRCLRLVLCCLFGIASIRALALLAAASVLTCASMLQQLIMLRNHVCCM